MRTTGPRLSIDGIALAADPERWRECGFGVDGDGVCRLGAVRLRLVGPEAGRGIVSWSIRGLPPRAGGEPPDLDGLPTTGSVRPPVEPGLHPNDATRLDHVVVFTPALERTVPVLEGAGLDLRRIRDAELPGGGVRQAFFRLDEVILEVIEQPAPDGSPADPDKPARLWGLAVRTPDLCATAAMVGERLGTARAAVQPGRRIATVRRAAGLGAAVAFITPDDAGSGDAAGPTPHRSR
jgi:Glyoxalase-like domain